MREDIVHFRRDLEVWGCLLEPSYTQPGKSFSILLAELTSCRSSKEYHAVSLALLSAIQNFRHGIHRVTLVASAPRQKINTRQTWSLSVARLFHSAREVVGVASRLSNCLGSDALSTQSEKQMMRQAFAQPQLCLQKQRQRYWACR